jgi:hypothetical protein
MHSWAMQALQECRFELPHWTRNRNQPGACLGQKRVRREIEGSRQELKCSRSEAYRLFALTVSPCYCKDSKTANSFNWNFTSFPIIKSHNIPKLYPLGGVASVSSLLRTHSSVLRGTTLVFKATYGKFQLDFRIESFRWVSYSFLFFFFNFSFIIHMCI